MSAVLRDLWPDDVITDVIVAPEEILKFQADRLTERSNGLLTGRITRLEGNDRVVIAFEVDAPRVGSTVKVLSVQHRLDLPYPVVIEPPESKLPDYLRKRKYIPPEPNPLTLTNISDLLKPYRKEGKWQENPWVAATPVEFSAAIEKLLSSDEVKALILSLLARSQSTPTSVESADVES